MLFLLRAINERGRRRTQKNLFADTVGRRVATGVTVTSESARKPANGSEKPCNGGRG